MVAVVEQVGVRLVARLPLVDAVRLDELQERLVGDVELPDRFDERQVDRMARRSGPDPAEVLLPRVEVGEPVALALVADVVGRPREGVERVEVLLRPAGKQERPDGEVFVVGLRQPRTGFEGSVGLSRVGLQAAIPRPSNRPPSSSCSPGPTSSSSSRRLRRSCHFARLVCSSRPACSSPSRRPTGTCISSP